MGQESQEEYINVHFTDNLLDYTVRKAKGGVVQGDGTDPVETGRHKDQITGKIVEKMHLKISRAVLTYRCK
jgi:hypothetical protein